MREKEAEKKVNGSPASLRRGADRTKKRWQREKRKVREREMERERDIERETHTE